MKIRIEQSDLIKGINIVQKAVPSKTTMPILKGILLEAKDNRLRLVANDMQIGIETYLDAEVIEEGSIVIDAKVLTDIIRRLKDDYVDITLNRNNAVEIKCRKVHMEIRGLNTEDFPKITKVSNEDFVTMDESSLSSMIKQTTFAVSRNESYSVFTGVLIEIDGRLVTMVATDWYRVAIRKQLLMNELDTNLKVVIPGSSLMEIGRLLSYEGNRKVKIAIEDRQALFVLGDTKLVTRLIDGDFINHKVMVPKESSTIMRINREELLNTLDISSVFAQNGNNDLVKFNITDDVLEISSKTEIGHIEEEIDIDLKGEDLEIGFNIRYLIEVLKVIDSREIEFHFNSSVAPGVIKSKDNYEYILAPVRMQRYGDVNL